MAQRTSRIVSVIAAAVAASLFAGHLQADSIGVQFSENGNVLAPTDSAGYSTVAQTNWNVLTGNTFASVALNDENAAPTTATISGSGGGTYFASNAFPTGGDHTLLDSMIFSGSQTNPITETISAIPYAYYDVYVYSTCDNPTRELSIGVATTTQTEYESLNPTTNSSSYVLATGTWNGTGTAPSDAPADYAYFSALTGSTLSITFVSPYNAGIDGFQIVQVPAPVSPVPEPASLGLLGLGAFSLLRRRRA